MVAGFRLARGFGAREPGAIDFFGPRFGLPKSMSGHMSYFLWGPGKYDDSDRGRCDEAGLGRVFSTVQRATVSALSTLVSCRFLEDNEKVVRIKVVLQDEMIQESHQPRR